MSKKLSFFSSISFLAKYMQKFKKHFIMFYVGCLCDSVVVVILPILFGSMVDEIVYRRNLSRFMDISFLFLLTILFLGGLAFLIYAQHTYLMNMFVFEIRRELFDHLQKCDARYLAGSSTGEIMAILQNYPGECMHFIIRNVIHMANNILVIALYVAGLFLIDWRIGGIALLAALLSAAINSTYEKKIRKMGDEERKYYEENVSWIYEILTALKDIRMLGAVDMAERKFEEKQKRIFGVKVKNSVKNLSAKNIISFTTLVFQLILYTVSAYSILHGNMTLGTLTIVLSYYGELSNRIKWVSYYYLDAQNRVSYIQRIYDFLQLPIEQGGTRKLMIKRGQIRFANISFGYENSGILLKDITLDIKAGEHIAIVGRSGCGKTTLAYLLAGFYRLQKGFIEIDGQHISECTLKSIREGIGLVQQDVLIFDGTIRENLLMGNIHATEKQLIEACKAVDLWEFVESLPMRLNTVIGNSGMGISGGQKQRIAIARIYLKNPGIIIFDEATSSLDSETEENIHQVWKRTFSGKTSIIIAHRQSSVMLCDRAVILENGRIIVEGNPFELEKNSERFQTLFAIKEGI